MFVRPTLDKNPDAILKSIILNAQSWTTTTPMPQACCNPCLHYSLGNDPKGRRSGVTAITEAPGLASCGFIYAA
jgi:hypothetical protein